MQTNVYQGSKTLIKLQMLDENGNPKDLSNVTDVTFVVAKKSDRKAVLDENDSEGSIEDAANGHIEITVNETALDSVTPESVDVPAGREFEPTATMYGYVSLSDGTNVIDKIYLSDVAIYFKTLPKV